MIDWKFRNLKQQALDVYDKQYWQDVASTYTDMGGEITYDQNTGFAEYNQPSRPLPSLPEMWGRYQKGAKSRGANPDFMTFKKYYNDLKAIKKQQVLTSLQQAQMQGIPLDKIHKAVRNNPGFRDEIIKTISTTQDPDVRASLAQYVPPIEKSFGQAIKDNQALLGGLAVGGAIAGNYAMTAAEPMGMDEIKSRMKSIPSKPGQPGDIYRGGTWIKGEADKEVDKLNKKVNTMSKDAPKASDYKTKAGKWKAKGGESDYLKAKAAHQKEVNKVIDERDKLRKTNQEQYNKDLKKWRKDKRDFKKVLKTDIDESRQSRLRKFMGTSRMGPAVGLATAFGAPMITESLAKNMGLNEADAAKVGKATELTVAAGYTAPVVLEASKIVTPLVKKGSSMSTIIKALSKGGLKGKALAAGVMLVGSLFGVRDTFNKTGSTTQTPTTTKKEPFKPII